ncbi:hypothetical protein ABW19_dt0203483 [Dactylella cylindrospora]|nr:hypothetical protein ABW19_dt0203483 [Dactylella cylindrospora]
MSRRLSKADYNVGWLCALPRESGAAVVVLDKEHGPPWDFTRSYNANEYDFGEIGHHNVVITTLPYGSYGTNSASSVATQFKNDFPNLDIHFMVGIGGGAPTNENDVRLGDVVVSAPSGTSPGVIQYDLGKIGRDGKLERVGTLNKPPVNILRALPRVRRLASEKLGLAMLKVLDEGMVSQDEDTYKQPASATSPDILFESDYRHPENRRGPCREVCDSNRAVSRPQRKQLRQISRGWEPQILDPQFQVPLVHYGLIASGNAVMKDAIERDRIQRETGALCFEMEAAGIMDVWPCLVVRGICDYCDSHKNKDWQDYAAGVAAAFTKFFLLKMHGRGPRPPSPELAQEYYQEEFASPEDDLDYDYDQQLAQTPDMYEQGPPHWGAYDYGSQNATPSHLHDQGGRSSRYDENGQVGNYYDQQKYNFPSQERYPPAHRDEEYYSDPADNERYDNDPEGDRAYHSDSYDDYPNSYQQPYSDRDQYQEYSNPAFQSPQYQPYRPEYSNNGQDIHTPNPVGQDGHDRYQPNHNSRYGDYNSRQPEPPSYHGFSPDSGQPGYRPRDVIQSGFHVNSTNYYQGDFRSAKNMYNNQSIDGRGGTVNIG